MHLSSFLLYLNLAALVKYGEENNSFSIEWKHLSVSIIVAISDGFADSQGNKSEYFSEWKPNKLHVHVLVYMC